MKNRGKILNHSLHDAGASPTKHENDIGALL
jgi:hypothetical protein